LVDPFIYTPPDNPAFVPDPMPGTVRVMKVLEDEETGRLAYELIPNIRALGDSWREGGNPPTGDLTYTFDDTLSIYDDETIPRELLPPTRFEQVFSLDSTNRCILQPDDRIAVLMDRPDGSHVVLFDGYALAPDAQVDRDGESCPFAAMATPVREFDYPLTGALWRDSDTPLESKSAMKTDLPARFNPDGKPNASPEKLDEDGNNTADYVYQTDEYTSPPFPVFIDPGYASPIKSGEPAEHYDFINARYWTLVMAAKYILMGNLTEKYTRRPHFDLLEHMLVARAPKENETTYDPHDPDTYVETDILCPDFDATDKPWPLALEELIGPYGFGLAWRLDTTADGFPDWWLDIYRKDEPITIQPLKAQAVGEDHESGKTNVTALSLTRDSREIVNTYAVQTEPYHYQAAFVLAPGFAINASAAANPNGFVTTEANVESVAADFRNFVLNENGADGHWNGGSMSYTPADLRNMIQEDGLDTPPLDDGVDPATIRRYAHRRRPSLKTLLDKDPDGNRIKARLFIAVGYNGGPVPGLYGSNPDGEPATYLREVNNGGWRLLEDRCGVRLTMNNPNDWDIGKKRGEPWFSNGTVPVVQCLAAPDADKRRPYFHLVLLCVIEGDRGLKAVAEKRPASPTKFTILRRDDARDHYRGEVRMTGGNSRNTYSPDVIAAQAHVEARRAANELPRMAGQVTLGRVTTVYQIGDKTDKIAGRDCSLRTTIAEAQNEGAQYPTIVGIDRRYGDEYHTVLMYEDRRAEPFMAGKEGDNDT
jgi:hypothetical protein